jgi:hypothetical protein
MSTITLDWLHIVTLLGAVQGFILAGVLAVRQRNRTANRRRGSPFITCGND